MRFTTRPDGIIEVHAGPGLSFFNEALNDAVSSRAPRGALRPGLSTYWIDKTEEGVRAAVADGSDTPFASGNATYLRLDHDRIVAAFDFDPEEEDTESLSVDDFLAVLAEWRQRVIDAGGASGPEAHEIGDTTKPRPMGPKAGA